jgi:diguanylate cyclase (GGDEF)-like protein/PAS domain S-box-containing protein
MRWLPRWAAARRAARTPAAELAAARPGPSVWRLARRDPWILSLLAALVALALFYETRIGGTAAEVVAFWAVQPVEDLFVLLLAVQVSRHPAMPLAAQKFWRAMAVTAGCFIVGDLVQTVFAALRPEPESTLAGTAQSALYALGVVVVVWVMMTYPLRTRLLRERVMFWLDASTVLAAALVASWVLTVSPALRAHHSDQLVPLLLSTGLTLAAGFAGAKLVLDGNGPMTRLSAGVVLACTIIQGAGNSLAPSHLDSPYLHTILLVRLLPSVLLLLGPRLQLLQLRGDATRVVRRAPRHYSTLPYVMVALTILLLFMSLPKTVGARAIGALIGLVLIGGLVVARQLMAFDENARLLSRLDDSLRELAVHERRFRSLVQHSSDITSVIGRDGRFTYLSPSVEPVLGYPPESVIGSPFFEFLHPDDRDAVLVQVVGLSNREPGAAVTYQSRFRHADGSWRWLEVINTNLVHEPGIAGVVSNSREITETRELNDRLRYQASHDALTKLANRALFTERLTAAVGVPPDRVNRRSSAPAVMLVDLDEFKAINDTYGHHAGDAVLVAVAERIRAAVRATDTPARLGGDEFAVLLPETGVATASEIAQRFLELLTEPLVVDGQPLLIQASIGIAVDVTGDPDAVLREADAAMYDAKRQGKGRYACADPETAGEESSPMDEMASR